MKGVVTRSGASKRKRRSSDNCSNIENEPVQDKKRTEEEQNCQSEEEGEGVSTDERLPLSELPRFAAGIHINDYDREYQSNSPESLIDISPCKVDSTILNKVTKDEAKFKNKLIYLMKDCKVVLHWPTILRKLDWENSKERQNVYICVPSNDSKIKGDVFDNHPGLQPRMRAVLLEWLIEVCDVFKLHRETYYLAVDYIDRYLFLTCDIAKVKLQLIGISCLLIACKIEEIYPPKVAEFAFVTDGACSENDILCMESNVINVLDWRFQCITSNCWLLIFLQLGYMLIRKEETLDYLYPVYPPDLYSTAAQLLDLVTLDVASMNYEYNMLAISVLYVIFAEKFPLQVSGFDFHEIKDCVYWMEAFWAAVIDKKKREDPNYQPRLSPPKRIVSDVTHFLQQHFVNLELLEIAQANVEHLKHPSPSSLNLLTPPSSSKKRECTEL